MNRRVGPAIVLTLLAGCAALPPPPTPTPGRTSSPALTATPSPRPTLTLPADGGTRPIVIDTDMAVDDIVAIAVLLRDPLVDVRAITVSGTGEVHCPAGTADLARLLTAFGRRDVPVGCGRETPGPNGREFPAEWRQAADDMYGLSLPPAQPVQASAVDLIIAAAAAADGRVTIVALGPWTNLADAFTAQPSLELDVALIHAMGGAFAVQGNVILGETRPENGVEWNVGVDPAAVAAVMATLVPITFIPLDATNDVPGTPQLAQSLAADHAAAGADIVNELFTKVPYMSTPDWYIWDPLAALSLTHSDLITDMVAANATITTDGPEAGRLVPATTGGRPVNFAASANATAVYEALLDKLRRGDPRR